MIKVTIELLSFIYLHIKLLKPHNLLISKSFLQGRHDHEGCKRPGQTRWSARLLGGRLTGRFGGKPPNKVWEGPGEFHQ